MIKRPGELTTTKTTTTAAEEESVLAVRGRTFPKVALAGAVVSPLSSSSRATEPTSSSSLHLALFFFYSCSWCLLLGCDFPKSIFGRKSKISCARREPLLSLFSLPPPPPRHVEYIPSTWSQVYTARSRARVHELLRWESVIPVSIRRPSSSFSSRAVLRNSRLKQITPRRVFATRVSPPNETARERERGAKAQTGTSVLDRRRYLIETALPATLLALLSRAETTRESGVSDPHLHIGDTPRSRQGRIAGIRDRKGLAPPSRARSSSQFSGSIVFGRYRATYVESHRPETRRTESRKRTGTLLLLPFRFETFDARSRNVRRNVRRLSRARSLQIASLNWGTPTRFSPLGAAPQRPGWRRRPKKKQRPSTGGEVSRNDVIGMCACTRVLQRPRYVA